MYLPVRLYVIFSFPFFIIVGFFFQTIRKRCVTCTVVVRLRYRIAEQYWPKIDLHVHLCQIYQQADHTQEPSIINNAHVTNIHLYGTSLDQHQSSNHTCLLSTTRFHSSVCSQCFLLWIFYFCQITDTSVHLYRETNTLTSSDRLVFAEI